MQEPLWSEGICTQLSYQRGVDDLTGHWDVAAVTQHRIEALEQRPIAPAFVNRSRNSQIVFASGTRSERPRPRRRMNESRSLIRY